MAELVLVLLGVVGPNVLDFVPLLPVRWMYSVYRDAIPDRVST
jgi:hypothetical protein